MYELGVLRIGAECQPGSGESKDSLEPSKPGGCAADTIPKTAGIGHCRDVEVDQIGHLLDVADISYSVVGGGVRTGFI